MSDLALLLGLLAALAPAPRPEGGEKISVEHTPVPCMVAGRLPQIRACPQPESDVVSGRVYFRAMGQAEWSSVEMQRDGNCFTGLLPAPKRDLWKIQYYVEVRDLTYVPWTTPQYESKVTLRPEGCATTSASGGKVAVTSVAGANVAPDGFQGAAHASGSGGKAAVLVVGAGAAVGGTVLALQHGGEAAGGTAGTAPTTTTATTAPPTTSPGSTVPPTTRPSTTTTTTATTLPPPTTRPPNPSTTTTTLPVTTTTLPVTTTTTLPVTTTTTTTTTLPVTTTTTLPVTTTTLPVTTTTTLPVTTTTTEPPTTTTTTEPPTTTTTPTTMSVGNRNAGLAPARALAPAPQPAPVGVSRLAVSGGLGQVVVNGAAAAYGGEGGWALDGPVVAGENRLEAVLVRGSGVAGTWRFELPFAEAGSLRVVAGDGSLDGAVAVVFRLRGRSGERVVLAFRSNAATKERSR